MRAAELERTLTATLGLAVIAGMEDSQHRAMADSAAALLGQIKDAGGLAALVRRLEEADQAQAVQVTGR